jgi:3-methyladenine DNA glycosylase/8-oxoguanine DNA glycosylase
VRLAVNSPLHLEATVRVLQRRPTNLIDIWEQRRYRRVIRISGKSLLIEVENCGSIDAPDVRLALRAEDRGSPATARERREAARVTSAILGLNVDVSAPQHHAEAEPALRDTALALRGMRPPHYPDLFETFASVIPFQQLSLEAGMAVVAKLVRRFGQALTYEGTGRFAFPTAPVIAEARTAALERCGMSRHKSRALHAVARAIASGTLTAAAIGRLSTCEALARLVELPGIGPWSAALILLRGFGRVDVFPQADSGAESSLIALMHLRSRASLARVVERFGEYRGFLYFYGLASRLLAAGLIHAAGRAPEAISGSGPEPSDTRANVARLNGRMRSRASRVLRRHRPPNTGGEK